MTPKNKIFRSRYAIEYSQHTCINAGYGKLLTATNMLSEGIRRLIFNNRNQQYFTIIVTKPANLPLYNSPRHDFQKAFRSIKWAFIEKTELFYFCKFFN